MSLDRECMDQSSAIVDCFKKCSVTRTEAGKAVDQALSVLQHNGLYALFLYLHSNGDKKAYMGLKELLFDFGAQKNLWANEQISIALGTAFENLYQLFFAIDLIERILIYTRYQVKAMSEPPKRTAAAGGAQ
jgi:hypothetical protein